VAKRKKVTPEPIHVPCLGGSDDEAPCQAPARVAVFGANPYVLPECMLLLVPCCEEHAASVGQEMSNTPLGRSEGYPFRGYRDFVRLARMVEDVMEERVNIPAEVVAALA
jgi:hypothetical protein